MPPRNPSPFSTVRAVAFDVDNTLIDIHHTKQRTYEAVAAVLEERGVPRNRAPHGETLLAWAWKHGIDAPDIVERYLTEHLQWIPDDNVVEDAVRVHDTAEAQEALAYPEAAPVLDDLADRGYGLLAVTDAPREAAERRLQGAGLLDRFEVLVALEDTPHGKKTAEPWEVALERSGLRPEELLCVGDHPVKDVARPVSIGCCGVLALHGERSGFNTVDEGWEAHGVVERLYGVVRLLAPVSPIGDAISESTDQR